MDKPKPNPTTPKAELIAFYDDFVEFNEYCAFLCDAVAALFTDALEGEPDTHTVLGLKRQCHDLKERAEQLECGLHKIYQQCEMDNNITPIKPHR